MACRTTGLRAAVSPDMHGFCWWKSPAMLRDLSLFHSFSCIDISEVTILGKTGCFQELVFSNRFWRHFGATKSYHRSCSHKTDANSLQTLSAKAIWEYEEVATTTRDPCRAAAGLGLPLPAKTAQSCQPVSSPTTTPGLRSSVSFEVAPMPHQASARISNTFKKKM